MFSTLKSKLSLLVLYYLRFWARRKLKKNPRAIIIGITGSAGKTSTRLALVQILKTRGVVKHSVHANSESGIPLNILGLQLKSYSHADWFKVICLAPISYYFWHETYDYYVVEMGIDSPHPPKNMAYLLTVIKPDISIVLGASHVHTASFDHLIKDTNPARRSAKLLALVAQHKMQLATATPALGTAILNLDNAPIVPHFRRVKARRLTIGRAKEAALQIVNTKLSRTGFSATYRYQNQTETLKLPDIFGIEYATTFAAALAAGLSLGIPLRTGIAALSSYRAPAGRMRIFAGIKNTHIIDSSYNSSPSTLATALTTLEQVAPRAPHLLILGDMRELGSLAKISHQQLAKKLAQKEAIFVLFGPLMERYVAPYLLCAKKTVYTRATMNELLTLLPNLLKPKMWILVKGSQNQILLERAVSALLAHPQDQDLLPRRGSYWDKIRQKTP
jgi:UDP-N-acetylmuramoyl-tripeptide--D-alanyl-D-alanine ligase